MFTDTHVPSEKILETLSDKEWHSVHEFYPLAEHIAPEIACRAYLRAVPQRSKETRLNAEPHIKVKYGRRRMIDERVRHLKRTGVIEVRGKGATKELRLNHRDTIMDVTKDDPPGRLYKYYEPFLDGISPDQKAEKQKDKAAKDLVIQDFQNYAEKTGENWICEAFPHHFFPLDLSAKKGYPDGETGVSKWICLEIKRAEGDNTLGKIQQGPSKGAFVPLHKIDNLGFALGFTIGYDRAGMVYIIGDQRYYIPKPILHILWIKEHPLRLKEGKKLEKEGNLSLNIPELLLWEGLEPFMEYVNKGVVEEH